MMHGRPGGCLTIPPALEAIGTWSVEAHVPILVLRLHQIVLAGGVAVQLTVGLLEKVAACLDAGDRGGEASRVAFLRGELVGLLNAAA